MGGVSFSKPYEKQHDILGWLYILNACAATAFWVYYLSQGFQSSGILDGFYEIQSASVSRGGLAIIPGPQDLFYHDVCIYKGSYYFYWGLLPSFFYLCISTVLGRAAAHYLCTAAFLFSFVYFFQLIIAKVIDSAGEHSETESTVIRLVPVPLLWLFLFSLPFNELDDWFYGRFVIYEQAIVFGLAFVMPAVYFAIRGFAERQSSYVCFSAFLMSLAAWTRATWLVLAVLSVPLAAYAYAKFRKDSTVKPKSTLERACLVCSGLLLLGLLAVNYARFDSLWDFGLAHQDSQMYIYQRGIARLFSYETRWWTFVTNILLYYAPLSYSEGLGLLEKSASVIEGTPPGFLASAPQFLVLAVLTPLGIHKMRRGKRGLIIPFLVGGFTALYINILVAGFGTAVIPRYFVECYFFVILLLFIVLLLLCHRLIGVIVMTGLLAIYIPYNAESFAKVRPQLRLMDPTSDITKSPVAEPGYRFFFMERNAVWPKGSVSTKNAGYFRRYNLIGMKPTAEDVLAAEDLATAYIIPSPGQGTTRGSNGCVTLRGLRALATDGSLGVFVDGRQIGRIALQAGLSVDTELCFSNDLGREGPAHVFMVFFPGNHTALAPQRACSPCFVFKELLLRR